MVAGASRIQAHQPLEDALTLLLGNARAGVGDGDFGGVVARAEVDVDRATGGGVPAGVVEQVAQDLRQPGRVRLDLELGQAGPDDREARRQHGRPVGFGVDHPGEVDVLHVQRQPGIDATQIKHVAHQASGAAGVGEQQGGATVLTARHLVVLMPAGVAGQLFGGDLDAGDRGAQLVGGVDKKSPGGRLGAPGILGRIAGPPLGGFQRLQHSVEGAGRATEFGIGALGAQSPAAIAGRDVGRQRGEPIQRPQRDPADRDRQQRRHQQRHHAGADHQLT